MSFGATICERCSRPTTFFTQIAPLGSEPGYHVFFCDSCDRYTWTTWRNTQQQQQPQAKSEPKE
jgi:hypothetical protein